MLPKNCISYLKALAGNTQNKYFDSYVLCLILQIIKMFKKKIIIQQQQLLSLKYIKWNIPEVQFPAKCLKPREF